MFESGIGILQSFARRSATAIGCDSSRWFMRLAQIAAVLSLTMAAMLVLDGRQLDGEPTWHKPFKFSISFVVLFATLSLVVGRLQNDWRRSRVLASSAGAAGAAFLFEMIYIITQAARSQPSHFNESTTFHEVMYGLMGVGASVLLLSIASVGTATYLDKKARLGPRLRMSIVSGFALSVVLTFWIAGELADNGGRYIGVPSDPDLKLFLFGWSMEVGDLRPAHFFALHAMQVLPAMGCLADRYNLPARFIWFASALYAIFTIMIFVKALQGTPLVSA